MKPEKYRTWIPAVIIGLVLGLPVIAWLFGGTSRDHHRPKSPPSVTSTPPAFGE